MRILVSNDDGIGAPGLRVLAEAARALTNDVWIVAPDRKWTAASHHLSFDCDLMLTRVEDRTFVCSGTPADCVVAAMTVVFSADTRPDLVLAGINDKPNVAEDVAYSGTMAIAREAAFWGPAAIALSAQDGVTGKSDEIDHVRRLVTVLWDGRRGWTGDGYWLAVTLPSVLPAKLVQARIGRDKIASASDVIEQTPERITYRLRRGRPRTTTEGDENAALAAGQIAVARHCWASDAPIPGSLLDTWNDILMG